MQTEREAHRAPPRHPVIIAGAGPVGLSTALVLARRGIANVVLEKKQSPDPHSRATLIVHRTLEILRDLGLLEEFLRAGQRSDAIRIVTKDDARPLLVFDFASLRQSTATPFALALAQDRTERILREAAVATGLCDIRPGCALQAFEERRDHVEVRTATDDRMQADWLVGADGAHSTVRKQLGWPLEGKTYPTRAFLADVDVRPNVDRPEGWLCDPTAASFTIAVRFGARRWRIIESAVAEELAEGAFEPHARALTERLFGPDAWLSTAWTAAYRKHERRSSRYARGRVVLAGDAAHLNSPAGGQGINAGIQDAALLGDVLADALVEPALAERLVSVYESQRIAAFDAEVRPLTDAIERMETSPRWLRNLVMMSLRHHRPQWLERSVTRRISMLKPVKADHGRVGLMP